MTKAKGDQTAQRATERDAKVRDGMEALAQWLRDLVRGGLGAEGVRRPETWQAISARLWDAQAQGVARRLAAIGNMLQSETNWAPRLLEELGKLHLLVEAYLRLGQLTPEQQADVRTAIGFTEKKVDLLTRDGTLDLWLALGRHFESDYEEKLRAQRTWLLGLRTGKMALLLDYTHQNMADRLDCSFPPATWLETVCVYYPSAYPLRAVAKNRESVPADPSQLPHAHPTFHSAFSAYAAALSANPWLECFPMLIANLTPFYEDDTLFLVASNGDALSVAGLEIMSLGRLLAVSGGAPITIFGEYNGRTFLPLSVFAQERLIIL